MEPLPRWTILPDDPPDLKRWLMAKQDEEREPDMEEPPFPDEGVPF